MLALVERGQHSADVGVQQLGDHRVLGRHGFSILDEVAERRLLVAADRHVQAHRIAAVLEQIGDLLDGNAGLCGEFLVGGFAAEVLMQLALDPGQLVHLLDQVNGQPDGAALIGHAASDRLTDPPRGVGRELEALCVVELLHRADQAEVAFLNQVEQRHAASGVPLRQRHHESKVRFEEMPARGVAIANDHRELPLAGLAEALASLEQMLSVEPGLNPLGQLDLVGRGEQCGLADAVQVHPHKVGGRTLCVQIAFNSAGGGVSHSALLITSNCHGVQRVERRGSSRTTARVTLLNCSYAAVT